MQHVVTLDKRHSQRSISGSLYVVGPLHFPVGASFAPIIVSVYECRMHMVNRVRFERVHVPEGVVIIKRLAFSQKHYACIMRACNAMHRG